LFPHVYGEWRSSGLIDVGIIPTYDVRQLPELQVTGQS